MVYTERDVRREVETAKAGLEHGSDWQKWVSSMRRLAGVALGGGGSEFAALVVGLVRASVHEMVGHKVRASDRTGVQLCVVCFFLPRGILTYILYMCTSAVLLFFCDFVAYHTSIHVDVYILRCPFFLRRTTDS